MILNFEEILQGYLQDKIGLCDNFLTIELAEHLRNHLLDLHRVDELELAGIGNDNLLTVDTSIRRDKIYWLDRKNQNEHENAFLDLVDEFVEHLNRTCFAGITDYEFHYAMYEPGAFYKRHIDQFKNNGNRAFSMITYLNPDWTPNDGGELVIYDEQEVFTIAPENRKSVFFKSDELEHEVLLCNAPRMSITGWLKVNALA